VIGHLKSDGLVERCHLAGSVGDGDAINAVLAAAGHNLRPLLAWLRLLCAWLLAARHSPPTCTALAHGSRNQVSPQNAWK
jgi:transposase, IS5 family